MALVLNLKCVENLHGKCDRIARVSFRGQTHQSRIVRSAKRVAYFGETFEWPVARDVEKDEFLTIQILNYNKYLSNKVVAVYLLGLQQIIEDGELKLSTEAMADLNNKSLATNITFEVNYYSPDGTVGQWAQEEFEYPLTDEDDDGSIFSGTTRSGRNLPSSLLASQPLRYNENGEADLLDIDEAMPGEDTVSQTLIMDAMFKGSKKRMDQIEQEMHKPRDFQICVRVLEGQQLAGLDIDPVVKIQVGDEHKYTAIKQSTNCPFYDEYFVFDFHESPATIFDKMITITAYHAYGIPGRNVIKAANMVAGKRMIGVFKCDVATVYTAPNHMYYHKWALLMDPKDMGEGPKGYVKCDISVIGKGDAVKAPKGIKEEDTNNIEGNLLLPVGISKNRETAVYSVNIYRAEDLPRTDFGGILDSVRKAISRGPIAFVDAYVKVSLAGHVGKTSVKKSYNPEWKESLKFVDKFPPLCNRIKVQLYDSDAVKDESIGTHFVELSQVMDPGGDSEGILPTFGPSWVNFYGAPRNYKLISEHDDLNFGLGEGSAYRGRLLMSISTQIVKENIGKSQVIREKLMRTGSLAHKTALKMENQPRKEFLLFATLFDATMIDKELREKPIYFEISIGHYGNTLDGRPTMKTTDGAESSSSSDEEDDDPSSTLIRKRKEEERELLCKSTTTPEKPLTTDKNYYHLPFGDTKQCLFVHSLYEDMKRRLYHTNILEKIVDELEEGLDDVKQMLRIDYESTHQRLRGVMKVFEDNCQNYISKAEGPILKGAQGVGKTDLDKYRLKMCKNKVDRMKSQAQTIKNKVNPSNVQPKFKEAKDLSRKMKQLSKDPQHSVPDVFIWMVCEKKRIAYYRVPAKDIIHSNTRDFIGKHCGKLQTVFLRKVGKKSLGPSGWAMQGKVSLYLWLGEKSVGNSVQKERKDLPKQKLYLENLPPGYDLKPSALPDVPPEAIVYREKQRFQLRAYLYQARSLIGSDDTGLSDPFARVIVGNECKSTQYVDETLSPTWDETLVFDNLTLYGPLTEILENPPVVIVEMYDYDTVGQPEFLGRCIIKPKVKTENELYEEPEWPAPLEWYDVFRGPRNAGEILASFELIQGDGSDAPDVPDTIRNKRGPYIPLPPTIKPVLKNFRVEVMFWGIREPKRLQLLSVDRPRADLEMAGRVISSTVIENMDKCSNFEDPIKYLDVMLPENELFWPPINIRVVDCRKFGRDVLLGICTISNVTQYVWVPPEERERQQEELRRKKLLMLPVSERMRQARLQELDEVQRTQLELVTAAMSQGVMFSGSQAGSVYGRSISGSGSGSGNNNTRLDVIAEQNALNSRMGSVANGFGSTNGSVIIDMGPTDATSLHSHSVAQQMDALSNRSRTSAAVDALSSRSRTSGQMDTLSHRSQILAPQVDGSLSQPQSPGTIDSRSIRSRPQSPGVRSSRSLPFSAKSHPLSLKSAKSGSLKSNRMITSSPTSHMTDPKHVSINVDGIDGMPGVGFQPDQMGMPPPPGQAAPPGKPPSQAAHEVSGPQQKKVAAKKRKELISDLDWWSKYYVTKEDIAKQERERLKKGKNNSSGSKGKKSVTIVLPEDEEISHDSNLSSESDYDIGAIDYEGFDDKKLAELRELHTAGDDSDDDDKKKKKKKKKDKKKKKKKRWVKPKDALQNMKGKLNHAFSKDSSDEDEHIVDVDDVEDSEDKSIISRITIYPHELEKVKDFGGFEEWVQNYDLFRGKKLDDEENDHLRVSGRFKGTICIYELTEDDKKREQEVASIQKKPHLKLMDGLPSHRPIEVKVMLYIVRALDLHPVDANGKADPYLIVKLGRREVNDKDNRQNNQLNPVFGKLYEFDVVFPMDSNLRIQVMDYDTLSSDDLIGETAFDLENRFYSKHLARCGLQQQYEEYGYNIWRDPMKPTQILEKLCKVHELSPPKYQKDCVYVGSQPFYATAEVEIDTGEVRPSNEPLALEVLRNWDDMLVPDCPLVPEHLETRPLYIQDKPGVEQGKLEMWVDMFPKDMPQPSVTVDITPRLPKSYELRCIIWNTDEVVLEDTNMLTGEASSDIFVKGYLKGIGEDDQSTDVHYRSLTGEGNFNWRFVYPFDYMKAEERIVYQTKGGVFDTSDTEMKVPAKLTLQVWDADLVSADDFLGYITMDLNRIPRPFKDAKKCSEKWMHKIIARDPGVPTINLFKSPKGCRGWWPMVAKQKEGGEDELVGKVEAEIQLLTAEEAERNPAGLGRSEPNPLAEPNRPKTSFMWFLNPWKTLKYIIWNNYKWTILKAFLILLLIAFVALLIYATPGATINKIFGL